MLPQTAARHSALLSARTCTAASTKLALKDEFAVAKKGANVRSRDSRTFGFLCEKPPLHFSKRSAGWTMRSDSVTKRWSELLKLRLLVDHYVAPHHHHHHQYRIRWGSRRWRRRRRRRRREDGVGGVAELGMDNNAE
jgi:hypothetical protein